MKFGLAFTVIFALVAVISAELVGSNDDKEMEFFDDDHKMTYPVLNRIRRNPARREASSESEEHEESEIESDETTTTTIRPRKAQRKPRQKLKAKPKAKPKGRSATSDTVPALGSDEGRYLQQALVENGVYPTYQTPTRVIINPYTSPYTGFGGIIPNALYGK